MIHGCFASITFCGCIVYHTENHTKRLYYNGSTLNEHRYYLDFATELYPQPRMYTEGQLLNYAYRKADPV